MQEYFLALDSSYDVMKAQKLLLSHNIPLRLTATPREFSHNCGVVISVQPAQAKPAVQLLAESPLKNVILFTRTDGRIERTDLT